MPYKIDPNIGPKKGWMNLEIGFDNADPQTNAEMVPDVESRLAALANAGGLSGKMLLVNGAASVPLSFVIAHKVAHLFGAVAVFDPKLSGFVIAISHDPEFKLGEVFNAS